MQPGNCPRLWCLPCRLHMQTGRRRQAARCCDGTFMPSIMRPSQPLALMRTLPTSMSTAKASPNRRRTAVRLHLSSRQMASVASTQACSYVVLVSLRQEFDFQLCTELPAALKAADEALHDGAFLPSRIREWSWRRQYTQTLNPHSSTLVWAAFCTGPRRR